MPGADFPPDDIRGSAPLMSTKDVILEMRSDLKRVGTDLVDLRREQLLLAEAIKADRETGLERRTRMFEAKSLIENRLDNHEYELKQLNEWRNEAMGALRLARWALGASLAATALMILDLIERFNSGI